MYKELKECVCCGNTTLVPCLDLNKQPLANSYHSGQPLPEYPLAVNVCDHCYHTQLSVAVDPDEMFKNYLYVSGTSGTLTRYFKKLVEDIAQLKPNRGDLLEIACNDGTCLDLLRKDGWNVLGVDPAENLASYCTDKGLNVLTKYWNLETAGLLKRKFDVVLAVNVFAHISNPQEFLLACQQVLADDGIIVIQTSQADMFLNNEFDCIYHEHISYWSTNSYKTIANRFNLKVIDCWKADIHGKSYVMVISKQGDERHVNQMIEIEQTQEGRKNLETYKIFGLKAKESVKQLGNKISEMRDKGFKVIGFGAAAKGNTILNFGKLKLDFIVDDNPLKWGLLTPGMNIPIKSPETLVDVGEKCAFVVLAWNFYPEIHAKVKSLRKNEQEDVFIRYFPKMLVTK